MTVFEPGEAGSQYLAEVQWGGPVTIQLSRKSMNATRASGKSDLVLLHLDGPELGCEVQYQLRTFLGNLEGVVPADVEREEYGSVRVPCVEPTEVGEVELVWKVTDELSVRSDGDRRGLQLRVAGRDDLFDPWVVPSHKEFWEMVRLSAEDAWLLLRVLWSAQAWTDRVADGRRHLVAELLQRAREARRGRVPGRMFEPDRVVEAWIDVPEHCGVDFVLHGDRVETRDSGDRRPPISLELERVDLTAEGLEALIDALGGLDLPNPLPLPLRVPLVEPALVHRHSSSWRLSDDVWLQQRGADAVCFSGPDGGVPPRRLELDEPGRWLLLRILVSIRTWLGESKVAAEEAIVARRSAIAAGRDLAQAPSDQMDGPHGEQEVRGRSRRTAQLSRHEHGRRRSLHSHADSRALRGDQARERAGARPGVRVHGHGHDTVAESVGAGARAFRLA